MRNVTLDLLRQVRSGKRSPSNLSGDEYQKLVFERLIEKLFDDPSVLSLEDQKRGEADYIVQEAPGTGMLAKKRVHYFECKHYKRALELDNVAKIMVVAVAEQPDSVHVVSGTRLQPQVWRYASRLFDTGMIGNPIFRGTAFRHWQTDQVLDFSEAKADGSDQQASNEQEREVAWWLTECLPFSESQISSSHSTTRRIDVPRGRLLHLAVELPISPATAELIGLPADSWVRIMDDGNGAVTLRYRIETNYLNEGESYQVSVRAVLGILDLRIPIGVICTGASASLLPELRRKEVEALSEQIGPFGKYRLILVDGEAGVGKTHFVERVAEDLRSRHDFDVLCFTVTEDNQDDLLARLVRDCLTPPLDRSSFKEVAAAVQRALLSDEFDARHLESDISLLARIASRMGPRIIVLRDCQYLSDQTVSQLWTLIVALNDASWGGLRLFLEFRQPEATSNAALMSLVERIRLKIRSVLLTKTIVPLTSQQLSALTGTMFVSITPEITDCLIQRTGGLPLFIDIYLHRLLDLGFVSRDARTLPLLRIDKPAQLLADTLPENGQLILEERTRHWLRTEFGEDANAVAVELSLLAIAEGASDQACMMKALSMPTERLATIGYALERGNLGRCRSNKNIVFRHDLFRTAVISVAKSITTFPARAKVAAENLERELDENSVQLRSLRARLFALLGDTLAHEAELRLGIEAANEASDYWHLIVFLARLLALLPGDSKIEESYDLKMQLAWALWESDSLLVARERYLDVAEEAERNTTEDFSITEAVATDAYRRAIGIDLELMEPALFLQNAIAVLKRRQSLVTFNSIVNRLVLFCARFGFPRVGYEFAELGFNYIGGGWRENEGAVLCSEVSALYALSNPDAALSLLQQGLDLTRDNSSERAHTELNILVLEALHQGANLDLATFSRIWKTSTEKRQSEVLTRASLFRGSLFLRAGDTKNGRIWINRTATMVTLYHRKDLHLLILNDQLLLAMLDGDLDEARRQLATYASALREVTAQYGAMVPLVEQAYAECRNAAKLLPADISPISRPSQPPAHCNPFGEMWTTVAWSAERLGMADIVKQFRSRPTWLQADATMNQNRLVDVGGQALVLGAR
jgi:hypothetical protein